VYTYLMKRFSQSDSLTSRMVVRFRRQPRPCALPRFVYTNASTLGSYISLPALHLFLLIWESSCCSKVRLIQERLGHIATMNKDRSNSVNTTGIFLIVLLFDAWQYNNFTRISRKSTGDSTRPFLEYINTYSRYVAAVYCIHLTICTRGLSPIFGEQEEKK
jgi:hypothetical protein